MRKILLSGFIVAVVIGGILLLTRIFLPDIFPFARQQAVISLAVMAPLSGPEKQNGIAMMNGIRLSVKHLQQRGQLKGYRIQLIEKNDQDDPRMAIKHASELAIDNKILLVLGHYSTTTALAASDVYKKNGIPVITASATMDRLTYDNEWYFRTVSSNREISAVAVSYIKHILKRQTASLIVDQGSYGASLAEDFQRSAASIGLPIHHIWSYDPGSKTIETKLKTIITELRTIPDPGAIFFATNEQEAVKIITSIKFPGTNYTMVGPDSFSTGTFIDALKEYGQERAQPGYYSDDIYVITPFLMELGRERADVFRHAYMAEYGEEPTWIAACYYDAMALTAAAIQQAEVYGTGNIRNERKKLKDTLEENMSSAEEAFEGITGNIYFIEGNSNLLPGIGVYQKQRLLPAFSQYQRLAEDGGGLQQGLFPNIIEIDNMRLKKRQVAYAGVDINRISSISTRRLTGIMDFYVWFRFQEDFDTANIVFENAVEPIRLEAPIMEITENGITTRAYHASGEFQGVFDFFRYPFDHPRLRIIFHHATRPKSSLVYVRDVLGLAHAFSGKEHLDRALTTQGGGGWEATQISHFGDTFGDVSALPTGQIVIDAPGIFFSRFNAVLHMKRVGTGWLLKSFFPILIMLLISYFLYFIPQDKLMVQLFTGVVAILVNVLYQTDLSRSFSKQGLIAIDYVFFTFYGLVVIALLIALGTYILHKRGIIHPIRILIWTGRILYVVVAGGVGVWLVYLFSTTE